MKNQIKRIVSIVLAIIALLGTSCVFAEETDSPVKILNYVEEPGATIYNTLQWDWSESGFETDSIVPYDPGNGGWTYTENNYVSTAFYSTSTSPNYNCYLYALGKTSGGKHNPGFYSTGSWSIILNDEQDFHSKVFSDLQAHGKTPRDSTFLENPLSGETKICYRFAYNAYGAIEDYHFMKCFSDTGTWRHKPGLTSILRYRKSITSSVWAGEAFTISNGWQSTPNYNGAIHYIIY